MRVLMGVFPVSVQEMKGIAWRHVLIVEHNIMQIALAEADLQAVIARNAGKMLVKE